MNNEPKWIDTGRIVQRYRLSGQGSQTAVLIHEAVGVIESWNAVVSDLFDYRTLTFDLRGSGLSEKIIGPITLDDHCDDIARLSDVLGLGRFAVVGVAFGGAIAMRFAARYPDRVSALIAFGPANGVANERRARAMEVANETQTGGPRLHPINIDSLFPMELRDHSDVFESWRHRLFILDSVSWAATRRLMASLDTAADAQQIKCPTLIVAGEIDGAQQPSVLSELASLIPNAQFKSIRSGHSMQVQTPRLVANTIRQFLEERG